MGALSGEETPSSTRLLNADTGLEQNFESGAFFLDWHLLLREKTDKNELNLGARERVTVKYLPGKLINPQDMVPITLSPGWGFL